MQLLARGTSSRRTRCSRSSRKWRERISRRWCGYTWPARSSACRRRSAGTCSTGLLAHAEDARDQNLPLMVWYAAEPVVELDMPRALALAADSKLPRLFSFTVQRIAAVGSQDALRVLAERLGRTKDPARQKELSGAIVQIVGRQ